MKLTDIRLNPKNPRKITPKDFAKTVESLKKNPWMMLLRPIVIDEDGIIMGGNQRYKALKHLGYKEIPDEWVKQGKDLTPEQWQDFVVLDNVSFGDWDADLLRDQYTMEQLEILGVDITIFGASKDDGKAEAAAKLMERFVIPPFTILDTRQGYWQERKKSWKTLILDESASRDNVLSPSKSRTPNYYQKKKYYEGLIGREMSNPEFEEKYFDEAFKGYDAGVLSGASIFDPVLAELINRWFGIENGTVCDPMAGGSFGFVANYLGMKFTGIELRQEQADINNKRIEGSKSRYICDDGQNIDKHLKPESQDLVFCCPPYFDLEVYSDLPNDASNQKSFEDFMRIIDNAFSAAIKCLKQDRFAVIVCGDIRDKIGMYRTFPDAIIEIFKKNGVGLYNELILVETIGSAAMRVNGAMKTRKVPKTHQNVLVFFKGGRKPTIKKGHENVLVFYKGDPAAIEKNFPPVQEQEVDFQIEN